VRATFRAAVSVLFLLGFLVVALVQFLLVLALAGWATWAGAAAGHRLGILLVVAAAGTPVLLWRTMRRPRPEPAAGLPVHPEHAPELWAQVRAVAAAAGSRAPDELRLVPGVAVGCTEDARLLGLVPGTRRLTVGLPVLQAVTVDELRALIARELCTGSGLAATAHRGRVAVAAAVGPIRRFNPFGWAFRGYRRLYRLAADAAARDLDLAAGRAADRVAGPAAAAAATRELILLSSAWDLYFSRYVGPGWAVGYAPEDLFGGFGFLLAARHDELDGFRARDTEPEPAPAGHRPDDRPAAVLLPQLDGWGRALQTDLVRNRRIVPWAQFAAAAITTEQQRTADRVFRALTRFTGRPTPDLSDLLDLTGTGRLGEFAEQFFPDATRKEAPARFAEVLTEIVELAAVRSGAARWQPSWTGPAVLTGAGGEPLDLGLIAVLAVDPDTVDDARLRLILAGVDARRTALVEARATGAGAEVIGALADVQVDGVATDVVLLDEGFVFVPAPAEGGDGQERLERIVSSGSPADLARHHRFLPYEEITAAEVRKLIPLQAELTVHGGARLVLRERWSSATLGRSSREAFTKVLEQLAER
jgi:hypothetical protein